MKVRHIEKKDKAEYLRMRLALWPDSGHEGLEHFFETPTWTVFVAERPDSKLCGFLELGQRNYAEGCETSPVAFIEGWYVDPEVQKHGVGRSLVKTAEAWAKEQGFTEMASDTWLDSEGSIRAHKALGYSEVERLVCFAKKLIPQT
jgi:aminoglycoside 6'-N-acetyltransferase I